MATIYVNAVGQTVLNYPAEREELSMKFQHTTQETERYIGY
ncbi:hypothetical protein [Paenibacillus alvei]|nr:hypothetical protein [Paenibacillus alvei]